MKQQGGMATLWTASCLIFITSLLAWMTLRSVMSETRRSQQQFYAAQAFANSESLLETSIALIDSTYSGQDIAIDTAFWRNASRSQCPASHAALQSQCLKWSGSGLALALALGNFDQSIAELPWPESIDPANSFVLFVRDVKMSPHKVKIMAQVSLNAEQAGVGSRATVQQSVYIPLSSLWIPPPLEISPPTKPTECIPLEWQKLFGSISPAQLKAISDAQVQNDLSNLTQPSRSVYWIDSPHTWTQSLGSQNSPVVLIFSANACAVQCPQIATSAAITGMVYFQSANACQNPVPLLTSNPEAYHYDWPAGIDTRRVQRVSGSWKNAGF